MMIKVMINRIKNCITTTVNPFDFIAQKHQPDKLKLGWCSVFPPTRNGASSVTYNFVERLMLREDADVYAIPFGGRIDKKLFPKIKFATLKSSYLDVIIFFCLGPYLENVLRKTQAKTIAWQTAHESIENDAGEKVLFEQLKNVDMILTLTKGTFDNYRQRGATKIDYLPAGVDTVRFRPGKLSGHRVLFASRIHYYKGVVAYLESIPLVLKVKPEVKFILHGPIDNNTNYFSEIMGLINRMKQEVPLNFSYNDEWLDSRNTHKIYDGSDMFVFTSDNEGFGVPMVEAMSCGMVCIVSDKPPMNEIIRNNVTGFCLPLRKGIEKKYHGYKFSHPEDIAAKIIYLIDNPQQLRLMGENARELAIKEYSIDNCIEKIVRIAKRMACKGD